MSVILLDLHFLAVGLVFRIDILINTAPTAITRNVHNVTEGGKVLEIILKHFISMMHLFSFEPVKPKYF